MAMSKVIACFAFLALLLCSIIAQSSAFSVSIFEHKHFKGRSASLDVRGGCLNVPMEWDDLASSIDPSACIIVYKHPNCQGPRVRLEPWTFGTAHLREINFEDKISSVSPCSLSTNRDSPRDSRDDF